MRSLYVVGGQQRQARKLLAPASWYDYGKGLVLRVDLDSGEVETCLEYVSPPEVRAAGEPPILFKCATLEGDRLYVCTHSEVLVYAVPSFERVGYVTLPRFNDIHHVRPTPDGNLLVTNTGLDSVIEVTTDGRVVHEWGVLGQDPAERFPTHVDYRKIVSTKPHRSHPNNTFYLDGNIWVTRFEQKDAVCLARPEEGIPIGVERLHDGVAAGECIYFTSVKGDVVIVDAATRHVQRIVDLTRFHPAGAILGWCRGLLVDEDRVWVGFSHIRPTRFRENLGWLAKGFRWSRATHLGCYDLRANCLVGEVELESHGLDAVFSIFDAAPELVTQACHASSSARPGRNVTRTAHLEPERVTN
ncbi:MAG: hypothetical protein M3069_24525 [Chloroflexota bacterium]|nr:hypothetical protein [Chloroflexota bacterium]